MKYFKIVDAGDFKSYSKKFLEYYIKNNNSFNQVNSFWNELKDEKLNEVLEFIPELKEGTNKFGQIKQIAILFLWKNEYGTLHTDHTVGLNNGVQARLQIPIMNTEGSMTAWFELNERQYKNHIVNGGGTKIWPDYYREMIKPISHTEIVEPTIIRTDKPHTVYCNVNKYPRITVTISFEEDVVKYLDEV